MSVFLLTDNIELHTKEGEVWEEDGKMWKLKNGVQISVPRISSTIINDKCSKCESNIETRLDKHYYAIRMLCTNCVIKEETQMRIKGTWDEFEKNEVNKNVANYIEQLKLDIDEYLDKDYKENINNSTVGQNGELDTWWEDGLNKEQLREIFYKQIDEFKQNYL